MVNYKLLGKLNRSNIRWKILELCISPKTVMELAKVLDKHKTSISRAVLDMAVEGLVICRNQDSHNFRYYEITPKGKLLIKK
jgi:predicted transcriptional regulator